MCLTVRLEHVEAVWTLLPAFFPVASFAVFSPFLLLVLSQCSTRWLLKYKLLFIVNVA